MGVGGWRRGLVERVCTKAVRIISGGIVPAARFELGLGCVLGQVQRGASPGPYPPEG